MSKHLQLFPTRKHPPASNSGRLLPVVGSFPENWVGRATTHRPAQHLHHTFQLDALRSPGNLRTLPYLLSLIHISEPTRLGMSSYAVFCLKKKKQKKEHNTPSREDAQDRYNTSLEQFEG